MTALMGKSANDSGGLVTCSFFVLRLMDDGRWHIVGKNSVTQYLHPLDKKIDEKMGMKVPENERIQVQPGDIMGFSLQLHNRSNVRIVIKGKESDSVRLYYSMQKALPTSRTSVDLSSFKMMECLPLFSATVGE